MKSLVAVLCVTLMGAIASAQSVDMGDLVRLRDSVPVTKPTKELLGSIKPFLVSADGSVIVGSGTDRVTRKRVPIVWSPDGSARRPAWGIGDHCNPLLLSADGKVLIAREGSLSKRRWHVWSEDAGPFAIRVGDDEELSGIMSISSDGSRVFAWIRGEGGNSYVNTALELPQGWNVDATLEERRVLRGLTVVYGQSADESIQYGTAHTRGDIWASWSIDGNERIVSDIEDAEPVHASRASDGRAVVLLNRPVGEGVTVFDKAAEYYRVVEGEDPERIVEADDDASRYVMKGASDGATVVVGIREKVGNDISSLGAIDAWIYTDELGLLEAGEALERMGIDIGNQRIKELRGVSADGSTIIGVSEADIRGKKLPIPFVVRIDG